MTGPPRARSTPAVPTASARDPHRERVRVLARVLDEAIRIPGTNIRLGLDSLIGLIPGAGDVAGGLMSAYVILTAARLGASKSVIARMLSNVAIDSLVGTFPVLGDVFDVAWKANRRNVDLLDRHLVAPSEAKRASRAFVALVLLALGLLIVGAVALAVAVVRLVMGLVTG